MIYKSFVKHTLLLCHTSFIIGASLLVYLIDVLGAHFEFFEALLIH